METKKYNEASEGISLGEILTELWNRKFIVIGMVVLGILCSFIYAKYFVKTEYTACAKMLITRTPVSDQGISTGDFSVSQYLIKDYKEIITDKVVLSRVVEELNLDMSVAKLKSDLEIKNPSNSRVLEIYVDSKTPQEAQRIANKICEVSKEEIYKILNNQDTINIMSRADMPKKSSGLKLPRYLAYGFFGGLIFAFVLVFFIRAIDDTIKGRQDVKKYLGLEVLSVIPYVKSKENSTNNTNQRK